jgi:site-specific DNA-cytosine methylase
MIPLETLPKPPQAFHINQREEVIDLGETAGALMATVNMQMQTFVSQEQLANDKNAPLAFAINQRKEVRDLRNVSAALTASQGMEMQTFISEKPLTAGFCAGAGAKAGGIGYSDELAPTLKASPSGNMMPSVLCINDQGGRNMDLSVECAGTLRAQEHGHQPLVYENHGIDCRYTGPMNVAPTICARAGEGGNNLPLALEQEVVGTLAASDCKGVNSQYVSQGKLIVEGPLLIRRLVPLECELLQGFPPEWTYIPGASDTARYKALGNSIAIPCAEFVLGGIVKYVNLEI